MYLLAIFLLCLWVERIKITACHITPTRMAKIKDRRSQTDWDVEYLTYNGVTVAAAVVN